MAPEPAQANGTVDADQTVAETPTDQPALQQEQPKQPFLPSPLLSMRLRASTSALPPTHSACPTAYFLRHATDTPLPKRAAANEMEAALSWGLLPAGPSFASLNQLLAGVLLPWLAAHGSNGGASAAVADGAATAGKADSPSVPLAGLAAAASKLCRQVEAGSQHLGGEVALPLPTGMDLHSALPEALASDEAAVLACEQCVVEWARLVGAMLEREAAAQPQGRGPLAELQHWQRRATVYGSLHEQLGLPAAAAVVEVVARGSSDPGLLASFRAQVRVGALDWLGGGPHEGRSASVRVPLCARLVPPPARPAGLGAGARHA